MKRRYYIALTVVTLCLAASLAMAVNRGLFTKAAPQEEALPEIVAVEYSQEEMSAMQELLTVYGKIDSLRVFYAAGTISVTEPADSTQNMVAQFTYAQQHDSVYYRLGENRILALPGLYLSVNDAVKKIFLSRNQKAPEAPFRMSQEKLLKLFREEGYHVEAIKGEGIKTIRLFLENHVFCKEYRLTFDDSYRIQEVYARFTNLKDPLNVNMDRIHSVKMTGWQTGNVPPGILSAGSMVQQQNGQMRPAAALAAYELVSAN